MMTRNSLLLFAVFLKCHWHWTKQTLMASQLVDLQTGVKEVRVIINGAELKFMLAQNIVLSQRKFNLGKLDNEGWV